MSTPKSKPSRAALLSQLHPPAFLHPVPFTQIRSHPYRPYLASPHPTNVPASQFSISRRRRARQPPFATAHPPKDDDPPDVPESPDDATADSDALQSAPRTKVIDPTVTKKRLLRILTALINLDTQRNKVQQLILQLEKLKNTPATEVFTELALAGEWVLLFSSTRTGTDGNIRIREIGQIFDIENKTLTNRVVWNYTSPDGIYRVFANLVVICTYKFVGPGRIDVTIKEHKITLEEGEGIENKAPKNMQPVVFELQRALPFEFFGPSGLIDVTYIEPDFRIARFMGKRIAGVRNIFIRPKDKADQAID